MYDMLSAELVAVVDGCADGAIVVDADHHVLHFNDAYARLVGRSRLQVKRRIADGARCSDLLPLSLCAHACVGCRATGSGLPIRVDRVSPRELLPINGSIADLVPDVQELQVCATPLAGGLVLETYRDTTAEARLHTRWREAIRKEREHNAELERVVADRTSELVLANDELRRAQSHLVQQEKMSSLGLLVAGVAHEINNPINFIVCNLPFLEQYVRALEQMLEALESAVSPTAHDAIDELRRALDIEYLSHDAPSLMQSIRTGAQRAAAIVGDLRTFSHGGDEHDGTFDLIAGIETTLNLVRPLLGPSVELVRELQPLPELVGQAGRMNQVFMNLLTNAIQAVVARPDQLGGVVTVRSRVEPGFVRVEVADEGIGILPEHRDRIFDPFFTTKTVGEGTGLGLSISYGIVERHGGQMTFTSEPGRGTTFVVRLPLPASDRDSEDETMHDAPRFSESEL